VIPDGLRRRRPFVLSSLWILFLAFHLARNGIDGYDLAIMGSLAIFYGAGLYLFRKGIPAQRAYLFAAAISGFTAFAAILPACLEGDSASIFLALVFWGAVTTAVLIWARIHLLDTPA
jgi:hypothetical protein